MPDRIAQWLLEAATTRERASSILGDLRESAATRGDVWFWASVLGTTASLSWRGLVEDPRVMLGLAFRGLLLILLIEIGMTIFLVTATLVIVSANSSTGVGWAPRHLSFWTLMVVYLCVEFFGSRWVARRAPGRELSACLALALVQFVGVMLALLLVPGPRGWAVDLGGFLATTLTCFLGGLSVRLGPTNA